MKKTRSYQRRPTSNPPGRPKTLEGDTQVVNLLLVREVCAKIDVIVEASAGKYASRSDFIREAIDVALGDIHIVDPRKLSADEKAGLGEPPKYWDGSADPEATKDDSQPAKTRRPPRHS